MGFGAKHEKDRLAIRVHVEKTGISEVIRYPERPVKNFHSWCLRAFIFETDRLITFFLSYLLRWFASAF